MLFFDKRDNSQFGEFQNMREIKEGRREAK